MRSPFQIFVFTIFAAVILALCLAPPPMAAQQTTTYRAPRFIGSQNPDVDSRIQLWNGDSRGHWEGNTLVIDFTNFTDKQEFVGLPQGSMHVTERLTKVDANTINYQVTIDDPTIWTKPWTWETPWRADDPGYQHPEDLYEYACHEGNFRMMEDLKGSIVLKQGQSGK